MEAKTWQATIMSDEQIRALKLEAIQIAWSHKFHPPFEKEKHLLETQAEISFKAGIKEVVEWVGYTHEPEDLLHNTKLIIPLVEWQAKLKEWGIE